MVRSQTKNRETKNLSEFDKHKEKSGKGFFSFLGLGLLMAVLAGLFSLLPGNNSQVDVGNVVDAGTDAVANVGGAAGDVADKAGELGSGAVDAGKDAAANVGEATGDVADKAGELGSGAVDAGKDVVANVGGAAGGLAGLGLGNLSSSLQSGEWELNQAVPVELKEPIQFDYNSAILTGDGKKAVGLLAEDIKEIDADKVSVQIIGHTSKTGNAETNLLLSRQRAEAVARELQNLNIGNDLQTEGKGFSAPLADIEPSDSSQQRTEVNLVRIK